MLTTVGHVLVSKKGETMSKESYARGFCKAAAAAGVDPVALAKYAQQVNAPENITSILKGYRSDMAHGLPRHVGPDISHAMTSAPTARVGAPANLASVFKGYRPGIAHGLLQHVGPGISNATTRAPAKK